MNKKLLISIINQIKIISENEKIKIEDKNKNNKRKFLK